MRQKIRLVLSVIILALPFLVIFTVDYFTLPEMADEKKSIPVLIPRGISIATLADTLYTRGLVEDPDLFVLWVSTLDKDRQIKAGYYEIPEGLNYAQLIKYLTESRAKEIKVTLIEGWRIEEIARELGQKLDIDPEKFNRLCRDADFIKSLGIEPTSLEGYLLPDTYFFYWGVSEEFLITFLVQKCRDIFTTEVKSRLDSMNFTEHQILTLASIIEGEAIFDEERPVVSSVYHNRLKRRIKLQADPTIQYILSGPPRRLLNRDLEIDSPYNTYKYYGLPPGPIANPGYKSIIAAIYPADTAFLYFVARGDGKHTFSKSLREHNRAKKQFDKVRREYYRGKKRGENQQGSR